MSKANEELFENDVRAASSNGEAVWLPSELAIALEQAYHLEILISERDKKLSYLKESMKNFMLEREYTELKTMYYNFDISIKSKASALDVSRIKKNEPDIYYKYLKTPDADKEISLQQNVVEINIADANNLIIKVNDETIRT